MKKRKHSLSTPPKSKRKDPFFDSPSDSEAHNDHESQSHKRRRKINDTSGESIFEPRVGIRIEICDPDNIWSSATIAKVDKVDKKRGSSPPLHNVTVRYEGWGPEWDESLTFEDNKRLVRFGKYTKRMKCFVDLLPKRGKKLSTLWPCVVYTRAPNPMVSLDDYLLAERFLKEEPNVFVQPYGIEEKYLPQSIISTSTNGGRWINAARIRMWRNDLKSLEGKLSSNFYSAYELAEKDDSVPETLTYGAFPHKSGSLVHAKYRIKPEGYPEEEETNQDDGASSISTSESMKNCNAKIITSSLLNNQPIYEPPAILPPAVKVNTSIYSESNIKKSSKTGKWIASFVKNGNEIILGCDFKTQTEAYNAIQAATSRHNEYPIPLSVETAKTQDMAKLSLSAIVSLESQQESCSSKGNFSLHEWTVQHTKHKGYELEKFRARFEELKKERQLRAIEERGRKLKKK